MIRLTATVLLDLIRPTVMNGEQLGMLVIGCVFALVGIIMTASPRLIAWSLTTRRGRQWVSLFGESKATFILRFIVSPLIVLMALVFLWGVLNGRVQ